MKRLRCALGVSALLLGSCLNNGGGSTTTPTGSDARLSFLVPDVPPGCPPTTGNELGIGGHCTRNGHQCPGGMSCLCDDRLGFAMPDGMPCFCTNPAVGACSFTKPNCGTKAICCEFPVTDTTVVSGCFPSVCLYGNTCPVIPWISPDAGTAPDANSDAASTRS
jgi:hypothetical protein